MPPRSRGEATARRQKRAPTGADRHDLHRLHHLSAFGPSSPWTTCLLVGQRVSRWFLRVSARPPAPQTYLRHRCRTATDHRRLARPSKAGPPAGRRRPERAPLRRTAQLSRPDPGDVDELVERGRSPLGQRGQRRVGEDHVRRDALGARHPMRHSRSRANSSSSTWTDTSRSGRACARAAESAPPADPAGPRSPPPRPSGSRVSRRRRPRRAGSAPDRQEPRRAALPAAGRARAE